MQSALTSERFDIRGDRSAAATFLLASSAASALLLFGATIWQRGVEIPSAGMVALQTGALVLSNAFQFAAAVAVAIWIQRAYANLAHLDAARSYSPAAAAAYFLIPGANLLVPHAVLRDLWRGSESTTVKTVTRPPSRPINVVTLWWYLFIASVLLGNLAGMLLMKPGQEERAKAILIAAAAGAAAAAVVGIDVIRLIDARQALRRNTLSRISAASSSPTSASASNVARATLRTDSGLRPAPQTPAAPPVVNPPRMIAPRPPEPRAQPKPSWREALLPVVSAIEKDVQRDQDVDATKIEIAPAPFAPAEFTHKIPAGLTAPTSAVVSVLFAIIAGMSLLQALFTVAVLVIGKFETRDMIGLMAATFPFGVLIYLLSIAGAVAFCAWVGRAYSNLRAYVPATPRSHFDAVNDFVRGAGDPTVIEEISLITMSASDASTLWRFESWGSTWRALQIAFGAGIVAFVVSRGTITAWVFVAVFLVWFRVAVLTRRVCREVSVAQRAHLTALSHPSAPAMSSSAASIPVPAP
jgi:hypothetical protein